MADRWGLGPVFVYESLLNARRWQVYAGRSLFVAMLLIGMGIVWIDANRSVTSNLRTFKQMAAIGQNFFYALISIQLSLVMLAAPAGAAGSICMDRARGTLLHMMVTDLSDTEIVLGKLGARLAPVFGLIACGVPVMALAALLGGIDFPALAGAFVVSLALATVGCAMAIAVSTRAKKTQDVLMAVFMIEIIYLLAVPIWWSLNLSSGWSAPPGWFQKLNPFVLVFAPYQNPDSVSFFDYAVFVAGALVIAVGLIRFSIVTLRRSIVSQEGGVEKAPQRVNRKRFLPALPGPTLDGNPVLWREWHRSRPSRLARILWAILFSVTWGLAVLGTYTILSTGSAAPPNALPIGFLFQYVFGLLMISALAPTLLAEERVRSSLDVLLSTPMSTRSILVGKWWGAYRWILILAVLPLYCSTILAAASPAIPNGTGSMRFPLPMVPLALADRVATAFMVPADIMASGAAIVSFGLAISTWVRNQGRAIALSVTMFLLIGIGWMALVPTLMSSVIYTQPYNQNETLRWMTEAVSSISPIFGPMASLENLVRIAFQSRELFWVLLCLVLLIKLAVAGGLFWLTVKTFDRCLGRTSESNRQSFPERDLDLNEPYAGVP